MTAEFFPLAFTAALNPKLLALDLLLIENRRPRAMFLCVLLGGMTVALTIGLLDVLTVHADAISSQGKASAGVDLGVGLLLLAAGGLLATGRLHGRRRAPVPAGTGPPDKPEKKDGWAARVLAGSHPRKAAVVRPGCCISPLYGVDPRLSVSLEIKRIPRRWGSSSCRHGGAGAPYRSGIRLRGECLGQRLPRTIRVPIYPR